MRRKDGTRKVLNLAAMLVLMIGLAQVEFFHNVTDVFAQDEVPQEEESAPAEETTVETGSSETSADGTAEEGVPSEEESATAEEEAAAEESADATSDETEAEETSTEAEVEADIAEVVELLAATDSTLVDGNGEEIPLTSTDAVEALTVADPYFTRGGTTYCYVPTGETPHPSLGCDVSYDVASPIQAAINDVDSNGLPDDGTIYVEPGTYEENVIIGVAGLTLYGDPGTETQDGADNNAPVLDGSSINGTGITINADSVTIIGFILQNYDVGITVNSAGGVLIKDNTLTDNTIGIKINNTSGSTKTVEIYGNVVESSETNSVGLHVQDTSSNSVFASLNSFLNQYKNVVDDSGESDFELFFNQWGYWDGGSYVVCTISGHTDADYNSLYTCARVEDVFAHELFVDGSVLPYVFGQDVTKNGEFCVDEKNTDYAVKTESGGGPLTLAAGESLAFVAVKQATGCSYQFAPTGDGSENGVYLDVLHQTHGLIEDCILVTRTTDQNGAHTYTFEVASEAEGCGISHVVGYFDPNTEEEPECEENCEQERYDLILDPYCVEVNGVAMLAWAINNPNSFAVDANWTLDGNPGSGTLVPGTTFIGYTPTGPSSHTLNVNWEFGEASSTSSEVCPPVTKIPPGDPPTIVENLLIPVTGAALGFQGMLPFAGSLILGLGLFALGLRSRKE